jgi:hypothetical protein
MWKHKKVLGVMHRGDVQVQVGASRCPKRAEVKLWFQGAQQYRRVDGFEAE